jgi:hypothetical protein
MKTTTVVKRNTQIVRDAMKAHTFSHMWTNKLANNRRTVKCYGSSKEMRKAIKRALCAAGVFDFEIRRGDVGPFGGKRATIVEVPCNW